MKLLSLLSWWLALSVFHRLSPALGAPAGESTPAPGLTVALTPSEIRFTWTTRDPAQIAIRESPLHTLADPAKDSTTIWIGASDTGSASVPRFDGSHDRLYAKYQILLPGHAEPLGDPQYVTDFSALPVRDEPLRRPTGKKGLGCIVDIGDVKDLGIEHAKEDIDIGQLIDWSSPTPEIAFNFEGRGVGLHARAVERLDARIKGMSDLGVNVMGCLLNYVQHDVDPRSPLVHPRTDPAKVPMGPAAFNTATPEGIRLYAAIVHWLIERYTRPDARYGRMTSLIVGNELQSHWSWYNMGEADQNDVIREYVTALRIADLAARSTLRDFHLYISMEHHWSLRGDSDDPLREISGIELIHGIAEKCRREGDFPWLVAFHPYPENLFEPRFWNDATAPLRLDAPRITFKNLEVLGEFLRQPEYLYEGRPRVIALTEQGFHCAKSPDGEERQAAAFAYAFKRIEAMPEIEFFIYHRHVDHPGEGGLRLGLREYDDAAPQGMGRKRRLWDVFQKAGTSEEDAAFAFALPIVGRRDWNNLVATKFEKSAPDGAATPGNVVFDFVAQRRSAHVTNTLALELRRLTKSAGWLATALQQHPNQTGASHVQWEITLPAAQAGKRLVLSYGALLNHAESHGAAFAILVDGKKRWEKKLAPMQNESGELDLSKEAGRKASVDFEIDPIDGNQFAWATWVEPRIIWKPGEK